MTSQEEHYRALATRLLREHFKPRVTELIKAEQERRGQAGEKMTPTGLARQLGYSSISGLQAVMNGRAQPPLHVLVGLAVELRLHSIEELFGDFGSGSAVVKQLVDE